MLVFSVHQPRVLLFGPVRPCTLNGNLPAGRPNAVGPRRALFHSLSAREAASVVPFGAMRNSWSYAVESVNWPAWTK